MSVYFIAGKGWRWDFTYQGARQTGAWFETKKKASHALQTRREELQNPKPLPETAADTGLLELINRRLDSVKARKTDSYYNDCRYACRRLLEAWGDIPCSNISGKMMDDYIINRAKGARVMANYDLRLIKALFNFGVKKKHISNNPTEGIEFLPVDKMIKYVPPQEDILKVIMAACIDDKDYLYTIRETLGRMGEINRLTWADVDFEKRCVVLYTRKKRGSNLTPREVPMTNKLFEILSRRFKQRNKKIPWVFWHRYWSVREGRFVEGTYRDRKRLMKTLCRKAGVRYFRYHALRHAGASLLDNAHVHIGAIQKILGHEERRTTEIYLHSIGDAERRAMEVFEGICEKSHTDSHTEKKAGSGPHG